MKIKCTKRVIITSITLLFTFVSYAQKDNKGIKLNNISFESGIGFNYLTFGYSFNSAYKNTIQPNFALYYNLYNSNLYSVLVGSRLAFKGSDKYFTYVNNSTKKIIEADEYKLVRTRYIETPIILYRSIPKLNLNIGLGVAAAYLLGGSKYHRTVDTVNNSINHHKYDILNEEHPPFNNWFLRRFDFLTIIRLKYQPTAIEKLSLGVEYNRSYVEMFKYYNFYNASFSFFLNYRFD